jgi:hypothetical protein
MKETITVTIRVRDSGTNGYGVIHVEIPASMIDWSLADSPRDPITLADLYSVDLAVGRPDEEPDVDTWDRD